MFGHKKTKKPAPVAPAPQPHVEHMSAEDFELLTDLACEIKGRFDCGNGDLLLDDAEAVYVATQGVSAPVVEIQYADCLVSLTMSVYHYTEEDLA